jgi:alcohol dehydrogenase
MDAFIHAVEAYVGKRANPFTDQFAVAAMRAAYKYLPRAVTNGQDREARTQMMLAALWGGIAMDHGGLGLVHSLSGPLSGYGHLHHGLSNALILPYGLRFNAPEIAPKRLRTIQSIFGLEKSQSADALFTSVRAFVQDLGLPSTLDEIDIQLDDAKRNVLAEETLKMVLIHNNPRTPEVEDCVALLKEMA